MFKFLQDKLICPLCHGELTWNVLEENQINIIEAHITCTSCGKEYSVKDQIANFLTENEVEDDTWQTGENYLDKLFKENPDLKERLMTAPLEEISAADMYVRADILKKEGLEKEAEELRGIAAKNAYTKESQDAGQEQFKYVVSLLKDEKQFVLDIASGYCTLVKEILQYTELPVVATDVSLNIIKKSYNSLCNSGYGERISFVAFDARRTPFRSNSIPVMTTFVGLQNIEKPGNTLAELRRISSGIFYSVCSFCSENDEANRSVLRKSGTEYMWLKESHKQEFIHNGWNVEVLNSVFAKSSPTPMGKILTNAAIDGFPVADGIFEHCIVKGSI